MLEQPLAQQLHLWVKQLSYFLMHFPGDSDYDGGGIEPLRRLEVVVYSESRSKIIVGLVSKQFLQCSSFGSAAKTASSDAENMSAESLHLHPRAQPGAAGGNSDGPMAWL